MPSFFEIPLTASPQTFSIPLAGVVYTMTLIFRQTPDGNGGWVLDIADSANNPIVAGIPLVTGADLLGQYGYLNLGGKLLVTTDGDQFAPPTFDNLGSTSHLYFATE